uniref:Putative reverse transcriptase and intron maturase n=1 Tax=Eutreptiella pomquetensis TaxID=215699 RepID=A0A223FM33_9EUGL|nr:putative reverse transcriptase and intron maturase [Eutreptiella pomquetensis]
MFKYKDKSSSFFRFFKKNSLLYLLYDIYYFEFDKFLVQIFSSYDPEFLENSTIVDHREFSTLRFLHYLYLRNWDQSFKTRISAVKYIKPLRNVNSMLSRNLLSSIKFFYCRYLTHWIVLFPASVDISKIKSWILEYMISNINANTVSRTCKEISVLTGFSFLGYSVKFSKTMAFNTPYILTSLKIYPDKFCILRSLLTKSVISRENFFPIAKRSWVNFSDYDIVLNFRRIILDLVYYYKYSYSLKSLHFVLYLLKFSCAKTLACKNRITLTQVFNKYGSVLTTEKRIYMGDYHRVYSISFPLLSEFKKI